MKEVENGEEGISIKPKLDWIDILVKCKNNVIEQISPCLKTLNEPQPSLGKGAGGDAMKMVDLVAEKAIVEILCQNKLSFTLVSEESGIQEYGNTPGDCFITADPIDGTTNLVHGISFYATSIAVSTKPKLSSVFAGLVTDLCHNVTYTALKDKGAFRDETRLSPSKLASLEEAVVGLDMNTYKVREIAPQLTDLIQRTRHIRHFGANALEVCYVADGTTDAFIDIRGKLRTTDLAAAYLIVKEAGGTITTPKGNNLDAKLDPMQKIKFIASGNQQLHEFILDLVRQE